MTRRQVLSLLTASPPVWRQAPIRVDDLLREAADFPPEQLRLVAGVFHWLMGHGEVLTLQTRREGAAQLLTLAQAKEDRPC
jgi:hypothetical protein